MCRKYIVVGILGFVVLLVGLLALMFVASNINAGRQLYSEEPVNTTYSPLFLRNAVLWAAGIVFVCMCLGVIGDITTGRRP